MVRCLDRVFGERHVAKRDGPPPPERGKDHDRRRDREIGHADPEDGGAPQRVVDGRVLPHRRDHPHRDRREHRDEDRDNRDLRGHGDALPDRVAHRPLVPQRVAQVPARQPDDVVDVLPLQRAVEPQAGLDRLAIQFSRAAGARFLEQDVDDAARNQPDHHDDDEHEQQHGGDDGRESPDSVRGHATGPASLSAAAADGAAPAAPTPARSWLRVCTRTALLADVVPAVRLRERGVPVPRSGGLLVTPDVALHHRAERSGEEHL